MYNVFECVHVICALKHNTGMISIFKTSTGKPVQTDTRDSRTDFKRTEFFLHKAFKIILYITDTDYYKCTDKGQFFRTECY